MKNNLQIFNFENKNVRTSIINGEPYFCLKDICDILEIQNNKRVKSEMLDLDGVRNTYVIDSLGRQQLVDFINESNLYEIIFLSRKPEAKKFKKWVFGEVLPQIRKTGSYNQDEMQRLIEKANFKSLMQTVQDQGENERMGGHGYSNYNNMIYKIVLGKNAKQIKKELGLNKTDCVKDFITPVQLKIIDLMER